MTPNEAMLVIENHRIRSPRKLRAAAQALLGYDMITYHNDIRRLLDRAKAAEAARDAAA